MLFLALIEPRKFIKKLRVNSNNVCENKILIRVIRNHIERQNKQEKLLEVTLIDGFFRMVDPLKAHCLELIPSVEEIEIAVRRCG